MNECRAIFKPRNPESKHFSVQAPGVPTTRNRIELSKITSFTLYLHVSIYFPRGNYFIQWLSQKQMIYDYQFNMKSP